MNGVYSMDRCGQALAASRLVLTSAQQAGVGVTPPRKAL